MRKYRGIFTSDRQDAQGDIIVDSGITLDRPVVALSHPIMRESIIGHVGEVESVDLGGGITGRRAYFSLFNDRDVRGLVPCVEGIVTERDGMPTAPLNTPTSAPSRITRCRIYGFALQPKSSNPDCNLEVWNGSAWKPCVHGEPAAEPVRAPYIRPGTDVARD